MIKVNQFGFFRFVLQAVRQKQPQEIRCFPAEVAMCGKKKIEASINVPFLSVPIPGQVYLPIHEWWVSSICMVNW